MAETFGLLLVNEGLVTREALYDALRLQRSDGGLLGTCLLSLGHLRRGPLLQALAKHLGIPPAPPSRVIHPDPALAFLFDADELRRLRAVPYRRDGMGVELAFADPRQLEALEALRSPHVGERIELRVAVEPDVDAGLETLLGPPPLPGDGRAPRGPLDTELLGEDPASRLPMSAPPRPRPPRVVTEAEPEGALFLGTPERSTVVERRPAVLEPSGPPPTPAPRPAPAASGVPEPAPSDAPAPTPVSGEAPERFRDEAEVDFARATGFDRERTAIFSLDDLAAEERRRRAAAPAPSAEDDAVPAPPEAPRLAEAAESLFEARNEGVLARSLVGFYSSHFPRVLLLARHGDVLRGVLGHGLGLSGPEVAALRIPASAFSRLFEQGLGYYGPAPGGRDLEPLYDALGEAAAMVLLVPIETREPPTWVVYADHGDRVERFDDVHDLEMMAKEAAIALNLLRSKE